MFGGGVELGGSGASDLGRVHGQGSVFFGLGLRETDYRTGVLTDQATHALSGTSKHVGEKRAVGVLLRAQGDVAFQTLCGKDPWVFFLAGDGQAF